MKYYGTIEQDKNIVVKLEANSLQDILNETQHYAELYEEDGPVNISIWKKGAKNTNLWKALENDFESQQYFKEIEQLIHKLLQ